MVSYLEEGRVNQKRRTWAAIVAAAAELLRRGKLPTVAEVADAAQVSRATAYRYFPTQDLLLAAAGVDMVAKEETARVLERAAEPAEPAGRVDAVVRADHAMTLAHEAAFRTYLSAVLALRREDDAAQVPRRPGNRLRWFAEALAPIREQLDPSAFRRLVHALSLCVGIESIIVTRDICALEPAEAEDVKRWAAQALVQAALAPRAHGGKTKPKQQKEKRNAEAHGLRA